MNSIATKHIETPRLILRPFRTDDCSDMLEFWASDHKVQCEYGEPVYKTRSEVMELLNTYIDGYKNNDYYRWAIVEKSGNNNIGQIAFCRVYSDCHTAEIEYCIGCDFQGKGYAGEALEAVIAYSFCNTDFLRLEAYHRKENVRSGRVLEKSVMHITDSVERFKRIGASHEDEVCYCINKHEYRDVSEK